MRKIFSAVAVVGLLAMGVAGCSSSGGTQSSEGAPITQESAASGGTQSSEGAPITQESAAGSWVLVDGKGPEGEVKPTEATPIELTIESDGQFSGSSGCNSIMGAMTVTDGSVDMGTIGQTMMACEEDAMTLEFAYTQALDSVTAGTASAEEMTLTGEGTELHFKPAGS